MRQVKLLINLENFRFDYPSGPIIDKLAKDGNPNRFEFPEPKVDGLNFSFSGLKTYILYFIQKEIKSNPNFIEENLNDLCASIQKENHRYTSK